METPQREWLILGIHFFFSLNMQLRNPGFLLCSGFSWAAWPLHEGSSPPVSPVLEKQSLEWGPARWLMGSSWCRQKFRAVGLFGRMGQNVLWDVMSRTWFWEENKHSWENAQSGFLETIMGVRPVQGKLITHPPAGWLSVKSLVTFKRTFFLERVQRWLSNHSLLLMIFLPRRHLWTGLLGVCLCSKIITNLWSHNQL